MQFLEDRIYEFNSARTGIDGGEWIALTIRDDAGRVVAGLCGALWGGCLDIRQPWVAEGRRRQGIGTRLLAAAEREAAQRRCRQLLLSTFSFQAPSFYERRGFQVLAVVDDHPIGHSNLLLRKWLEPGHARTPGFEPDASDRAGSIRPAATVVTRSLCRRPDHPAAA